jgi:hypothetical protein
VGKPKPLLEIKMAVTMRGDREKGIRRQSSRRKGNIETITIGGQGDKGQEVTVRYETAPQRKEESTFSWFEQFTIEWSETFVRKKKKKIQIIE